jgi:ankyrin repeat protein
MAPPNRQGPFGNTLLHSAVISGDKAEVRRLLDAGANPAITNREGLSALKTAAILGDDEMYGLLARNQHLDRLLDHALEETFPASDPIAVTPRNR